MKPENIRRVSSRIPLCWLGTPRERRPRDVPESPELTIPAMCFLFDSFFQGKSDLLLFPQHPKLAWYEFPGPLSRWGFVFSEPDSQMTSKAEQT